MQILTTTKRLGYLYCAKHRLYQMLLLWCLTNSALMWRTECNKSRNYEVWITGIPESAEFQTNFL